MVFSFTPRVSLILMLLAPVATMAQAGGAALHLDEALQSARSSHPGIIAARAGIRAETGRRLSALSPESPTIVLRHEDIPGGASFGDAGQKILEISQSFDLPLLLGARGRLSSGLIRAQEWELALMERRVRAGVITAYARLYAVARQDALLRRNAANAAEFAAKVQRRIDAGDGTPLELLRARAERASADAAVAAAAQRRAVAVGALEEAMGRDLPDDVDAVDSLPPLAIDPAGLGRPDELVREHPEWCAAQERAGAMAADAGWRWMEYLPRFNASWFQQDYAAAGRLWGVQLGAELPLWFLLGARGSAMERDAEAERASAESRGVAIAVAARIQSSITALAAAERGLAAYTRDILAEAAEITRVATASYDAGQINHLEYLDAMRSANGVVLGYYDALASYYQAVAECEAATGHRLIP